MSSEVPSDLIKQSQIAFREDAGLSSYKPTLKSLPTVQNSLETSDNCIKCKHCNAKLLRGSHSLICIYCGQCQAKDLPPQPIVFNSTTSYRLLLQSLNLDASETTGSFFEENIRNKGGTSAEVGITLAEVLDMKIEWRDEAEIPETGFVNEAFDYNNLLNLDKVGLEKFVTGSERDVGSDVSEEQSISNRNDQNDALTDQENPSLFENHVLPETDARSSASFERDSEIEDSKTDLNMDSSFGDDAEVHSFRSQDEDFKATVSRDSSIGDDAEINSKNSNEDSNVSFDLRDNSSSHNAEIESINSRPENEYSKTDLKKDSSSVDEEEINSLKQNDDLRNDFPSEHVTETQHMSLRTQNEDS